MPIGSPPNTNTEPADSGKEFNMTINAIPLTPVESSQIHSIGHDAETNTLAIRFKNYKGEPSSLYQYRNFTADDFAAFKSAESIGSHFGKHIKKEVEKHPFQKIDEVDPADQESRA